jgi:nucleotide-binding universal stress UspA family protein
MKSILVPTDFSEQAENALDFAAQIAANSGAKVQLLHVLEHPSESAFNSMGIATIDNDPMDNIYLIKMMEAAKAKMEEIVANDAYEKITLEYNIIVGRPFEQITKTLGDNDCDLVVMGTTGSSGLEEMLVGSNTERVVRRAHCPVISIKDKANFGAIKNIAFASDFADKYDELIERLKELQKLFDARLSLVRINTPNSFTTTRHDLSLMKKFAEAHQLENYTMDIYNDTLEDVGIIYYAEDAGAALIALGTHKRKGIVNLLSGSIAEDVVNHSSRPVWTFKLK